MKNRVFSGIMALALGLATAAGLQSPRLAHAEDSQAYHQVTYQKTIKVQSKQKGSADLTITALKGYELHTDTPLSVKLSGDKELTLPQSEFNQKDVATRTKNQVSFKLPFVAGATGKYKLMADADFYVCSDDACRPIKEQITWLVEVVN